MFPSSNCCIETQGVVDGWYRVKVTQVVILAAGRGTRLGSLKDPRSKAMMPVVGVPLIGCVLRAFLETGLRKFVVVHRPGDRELEVYLQKFREGEAQVQCAVQEEPQGMGHALGCAVPLINDRFLLTACDSVFSKESLARFIGQWELRRDVEALLGLEYAKNKDLSQRSAVVLDGLKIRQIVEKPAVHEITTDVTSVPLYGFGEKILPAIHRLERSLRGEFELQPAISGLDHARGNGRGYLY